MRPMRPASEASARAGPSGADAFLWAHPDSPGPDPAASATTTTAREEAGRRRARITDQFSSSLPGWYAFRVWRRPNGAELPVVVAHRGASAVETENTVPAFARARADGADGVELDAMICGTGEVLVFHDDDLTRLAHRPERIADTAF